MITTLVKDADYRSFRSDLRRLGYFVTLSVFTSRGFLVTYSTDPR